MTTPRTGSSPAHACHPCFSSSVSAVLSRIMGASPRFSSNKLQRSDSRRAHIKHYSETISIARAPKTPHFQISLSSSRLQSTTITQHLRRGLDSGSSPTANSNKQSHGCGFFWRLARAFHNAHHTKVVLTCHEPSPCIE